MSVDIVEVRLLTEYDTCFQKDSSVVFREIAGEAILVPIRRNVGDLESIYTLNETAARVWELIDGKRSIQEITDAIVTEFEVEREVAERDVLELLAGLESFQAVKKA